MISSDQGRSAVGKTAYSRDGEKIGRIGQIYIDDASGQPEWASVSTGLFGTRESLVPLRGADLGSDDVRLAFSKDEIRNAPNVDPDEGRLSEDEERRLFGHYGVDYGPQGYATGTTNDEGYAGFGSAHYREVARGEPSGRYGSDLAGIGRPSGSVDAAAAARQGSADPQLDPATIQNAERVSSEAGEEFRVRLRRYKQDPGSSDRPLTEQAWDEDEQAAGRRTQEGPGTDRLM